MQINAAQFAAEKFLEFLTDPEDSIAELFGEQTRAHEAVASATCEYVTDWLHLWLLSGAAHSVCNGNALEYALALTIIFCEQLTNPVLFHDVVACPPNPLWYSNSGASEESRFVTAQEFLVPEALTAAAFERTRGLSSEQRIEAIVQFARSTEALRYGFIISRLQKPRD